MPCAEASTSPVVEARAPPPLQQRNQRAQRNVGGPSSSSSSSSSSEEKFATGETVAALRTVEREMEAAARLVPAGVVVEVVATVRDSATARLAAKVLVVVLLEEGNREAAVAAGVAAAAVEAVGASGPAGATAERALATLDLLCTAPGSAAAVRGEALAASVLARAVEGMAGRGWECTIDVLTAIYGGGGAGVEDGAAPPLTPPEMVKGECSASKMVTID